MDSDFGGKPDNQFILLALDGADEHYLLTMMQHFQLQEWNQVFQLNASEFGRLMRKDCILFALHKKCEMFFFYSQEKNKKTQLLRSLHQSCIRLCWLKITRT